MEYGLQPVETMLKSQRIRMTAMVTAITRPKYEESLSIEETDQWEAEVENGEEPGRTVEIYLFEGRVPQYDALTRSHLTIWQYPHRDPKEAVSNVLSLVNPNICNWDIHR